MFPTLAHDSVPEPSPIIVASNSIESSTDAEWVYGPSRFLKYMNTEYQSIQQNGTRRSAQLIVYEKKGTTGMAGQIVGVCDALLLGILHDRPVQSAISTIK